MARAVWLLRAQPSPLPRALLATQAQQAIATKPRGCSSCWPFGRWHVRPPGSYRHSAAGDLIYQFYSRCLLTQRDSFTMRMPTGILPNLKRSRPLSRPALRGGPHFRVATSPSLMACHRQWRMAMRGVRMSAQALFLQVLCFNMHIVVTRVQFLRRGTQGLGRLG